jgi:glycosyltransferase involved in cell wall biosynthesis
MISPAALREWASKASIGIFLLDDKGENQYLALPNKFFDNIEAGLPQITCRYPELESINQQYPVALLLDSVEVNSVANAVNALIADAEKREKMQKACIEARTIYSWQNESHKLLEFYKKVFTT